VKITRFMVYLDFQVNLKVVVANAV